MAPLVRSLRVLTTAVPTAPQTGQESATTPGAAAVTIRSSKLQISMESSLYMYLFSPTLRLTMSTARGLSASFPFAESRGPPDGSGAVRLEERAVEGAAVC